MIDWYNRYPSEKGMSLVDNKLIVSSDLVRSLVIECGEAASDDSCSTISKRLYVKLNGGVIRRRTLAPSTIKKYCDAWFQAKEDESSSSSVFRSLHNLAEHCMDNLDEIVVVMRHSQQDESESGNDDDDE